MAQTGNRPGPEELAQKLNEMLGRISPLKTEAPGVYYLTVRNFGETYMVEESSSTISDEVKGYGKKYSDYPGLLFYPFNETKGGFKLVAYELEKYAVKQRFSGHDSASLRSVAVYAAEYHPEFFGTYPVPLHTPWGCTIRHRSIENGVYWLETDLCREVLTICYPIWDADLSAEAVGLGVVTEYDQLHDINATLGYRFYKKADACVPIFELLKTRMHWSRTGQIDVPTLMNAIWRDHPDYALNHNIKEQTGANDEISLLFRQLGIEVDPNISQENMITLFPDAGVEYLHF